MKDEIIKDLFDIALSYRDSVKGYPVDWSPRVSAITAILPYLSQSKKRDALKIIKRDVALLEQAFAKNIHLANALRVSSNILSQEEKVDLIREQILRKVIDAQYQESEYYGLAVDIPSTDGISDMWVGLDTNNRYDLWQDLSSTLLNQTRQSFLLDIIKFKNVLLRIGSEKAIVEIIKAIVDVGSWWP